MSVEKERHNGEDEPFDVESAFAEIVADWHVDTTEAVRKAERDLSREDANWRAALQPPVEELADPTYWPEEHYEPPPPPPALPRLAAPTAPAQSVLLTQCRSY